MNSSKITVITANTKYFDKVCSENTSRLKTDNRSIGKSAEELLFEVNKKLILLIITNIQATSRPRLKQIKTKLKINGTYLNKKSRGIC
jgi:hypothetical protein